MTAAEARRLASADTFRPFRVMAHDGRQFEIPTHFDVMASMGELLIGVDHDPQTGIPETAEHLRYKDVRHYEFLSADTPAVAA